MPPQHSDISPSSLLAELNANNAYFDSVVNMIPAKLYVAGASGDDAYNVKYLKGQHKESREVRKARNKVAKQEKFDPEKMETTLEAKKRLKREEEERDDSDDDGDIVMSDGDGEDENDVAGDKEKPPPSDQKDGDKNAETKIYASRIEMLRAKLHAKMAEKRKAAGKTADAPDDGSATIDTSAPALVSKRAARRAEKRKRKEAATQRNKKKATSVAETKKKTEQRVVNLGGSKFNEPTASKSAKTGDSAADDLATIDFQSLAGLKPKADGARDNKSLGSGGKKKKKNLEHLLADAERKQQRLNELKSSGKQEDKEKAENIQWGDALKIASGTNTRKTNDPKLLKKALKRKAKSKVASSKAWNVRLDQAKEAATKRQAIRSHNLDQRKIGGSAGANLSSKRIKEDQNGGGEGGEGGTKEKRRRAGPHANREGFEGKKSGGFINGGEGGGSSSGGKSGKQ